MEDKQPSANSIASTKAKQVEVVLHISNTWCTNRSEHQHRVMGLSHSISIEDCLHTLTLHSDMFVDIRLHKLPTSKFLKEHKFSPNEHEGIPIAKR